MRAQYPPAKATLREITTRLHHVITAHIPQNVEVVLMLQRSGGDNLLTAASSMAKRESVMILEEVAQEWRNG